MKIPVKKVLLIAAVLLAAAAVILYCTLGGKSGASAARAWSGNDDALTELSQLYLRDAVDPCKLGQIVVGQSVGK